MARQFLLTYGPSDDAEGAKALLELFKTIARSEKITIQGMVPGASGAKFANRIGYFLSAEFGDDRAGAFHEIEQCLSRAVVQVAPTLCARKPILSSAKRGWHFQVG